MQKFISLFLILLISLSSVPAYSCFIPNPSDLVEAFKKSDIVFSGTLKNAQCELIENSDNATQTKIYKVETIWKGTIERYITTKELIPAFMCDKELCEKKFPSSRSFPSSPMCDDTKPEIHIGTRYLIYGYYKDSSEYITIDHGSSCGDISRSLPSYWDTVRKRMWIMLTQWRDIGMGDYYNVYVPGDAPLKTF